MSATSLAIVEAEQLSEASDQIQRFASFINAGVNAWTEAGKLLVEMKDADPNIFDKITAKYPGISYDILRAFENIGLKRVYPYLMLDSCPGSKKLLTFPYDKQVKFYQAKIEVVIGFDDGKPMVATKRIQELNSFEIDRLFIGERIKNVTEQSADWEARVIRKKIVPQNKVKMLDDLADRVQSLAPVKNGARAEFLKNNPNARAMQAAQFKEIAECVDAYRSLPEESEEAVAAGMEAGLEIIGFIETLPLKKLTLDLWLQIKGELLDGSGNEIQLKLLNELVALANTDGKNYFYFESQFEAADENAEQSISTPLFEASDHAGTNESHELVGTVDFNYGAIDGDPEEDKRPDMLMGLRRLLEWVWILDSGTVRNPKDAFTRFAAMTSVVSPTATAGMNYEEIGAMFGVTKSLIGKHAVDFSDDFGIQFAGRRDLDGRANMSRAMKESHARRRAAGIPSKTTKQLE